jgi:hypothetical protein
MSSVDYNITTEMYSAVLNMKLVYRKFGMTSASTISHTLFKISLKPQSSLISIVVTVTNFECLQTKKLTAEELFSTINNQYRTTK